MERSEVFEAHIADMRVPRWPGPNTKSPQQKVTATWSHGGCGGCGKARASPENGSQTGRRNYSIDLVKDSATPSAASALALIRSDPSALSPSRPLASTLLDSLPLDFGRKTFGSAPSATGSCPSSSFTKPSVSSNLRSRRTCISCCGNVIRGLESRCSSRAR